MPQGLSVARVVNVQVNLSPPAAQFANFNSLLIIGDSDVIDTQERIRAYEQLDDIGSDFGTDAPEYLAAERFFGQKPQPTSVMIGRWARTPTHGLLLGGILNGAQQSLSNFSGITTGGLKIAVDGGALVDVTGINLTAAANLNAVASAIQAAFDTAGVGATIVYDGVYHQFKITSDTTGAASSVAPTQPPSAGTDLGPLILTNAATRLRQVNGIVAETAGTNIALMDNQAQPFYFVGYATPNLDAQGAQDVAAYIEASANPHIFGVTVTDTTALSSTDTTSLGYLLKQSGYERTFTQFSSSDPYAAFSMIGRAATVDFNGQNTTITLMFKQEPGVVAELLQSSQANALDVNNYSYFAAFNNGTNILVGGKMVNGFYFDEVHGTDWLRDQIRTDVYNLLFTSLTKIPQTDQGNHMIATQIEAACRAGVNNGLLAPGVWNEGGFGTLAFGDFLTKGYYVYAPPIANQAQADRDARKSVSFQVAAKLAGAIHDVVIDVLVNR
jgi:hypothetical protein